GTVVAEFIVTRTGKVIRIDIINSTSREFNDPVINALRRWQFEPGIKDDQKVNTRVRIPFNFRLDQA
ncbi:MAG: energy transducer TonB, partial [Verrucomicrobiae bacterium]|nr:energy transducer TonB [Verrucomicrobiae bacterium]